jgi:hypothetical protein
MQSFEPFNEELLEMIIYAIAPRKNSHGTMQVEYDNCQAINGVSGTIAIHSRESFEDVMRLRGNTVIWVKDLDDEWKRRNPP